MWRDRLSRRGAGGLGEPVWDAGDGASRTRLVAENSAATDARHRGRPTGGRSRRLHARRRARIDSV